MHSPSSQNSPFWLQSKSETQGSFVDSRRGQLFFPSSSNVHFRWQSKFPSQKSPVSQMPFLQSSLPPQSSLETQRRSSMQNPW